MSPADRPSAPLAGAGTRRTPRFGVSERSGGWRVAQEPRRAGLGVEPGPQVQIVPALWSLLQGSGSADYGSGRVLLVTTMQRPCDTGPTADAGRSNREVSGGRRGLNTGTRGASRGATPLFAFYSRGGYLGPPIPSELRIRVANSLRTLNSLSIRVLFEGGTLAQ